MLLIQSKFKHIIFHKNLLMESKIFKLSTFVFNQYYKYNSAFHNISY